MLKNLYGNVKLFRRVFRNIYKNNNENNWTAGLRGSNCMRPNNDKWKDQVIDIYKKLKVI